jgi:hypothetical protein
MRKALAICAVVAVLAIFAGSAQAGHGCGYGYGGYGGGWSGYSTGYSFGGPSYYGGFVGQPHYHWHDTSHWDYHPTTIVPHGNHFHVVPGHYHWHSTGHWDPHW